MNRFFTVLFALALAVTLPAQTFAQKKITLNKIGGYETGIFDEAAAEISAFDPYTQRLFVTNADSKTIEVLDLSYPSNPTFLFSIDVTPYGDGVNSVAVNDGLLAAAIENEVAQEPGVVAFFDMDGTFKTQAHVGALPDMVTFTPDGRLVLVALEGEPDDDYVVDPIGQVGIIRRPSPDYMRRNMPKDKVNLLDFSAYNDVRLDPSIRIFGPGASVAQDVEPEYIAVSDDSRYAFVTLQENNALGVVDLKNGGEIVALKGLGFKNHKKYGNGLDASNRDDKINIQSWPVLGMYQPDAIAYYTAGDGKGYLVTANEGDARDYDGFSEEERMGDLQLDPSVFPNAAELQLEENLGRLNSTTANGDKDGDGYFEKLFAYGARSFSIWTTTGDQVYDSRDEFEQITAELFPDDFNSTNDENDSFDNRSDDKGPEPEGVVVGEVDGRSYAFVGLERIGGIMVYDITNPKRGRFIEYVTSRDFSGDAEAGTAGDLAPEGLVFIPAEESPNGYPLLVVSHEVSGSVAVFQIEKAKRSEAEIASSATGDLDASKNIETPVSFGLQQNYPNPFNPTTTIQYAIEADVQVKLSVYNVLGQEVRSLVNGAQTAGEYSATWNGRNQAGQLVPSGMYYYRLEAGDFSMTRSMLLAK